MPLTYDELNDEQKTLLKDSDIDKGDFDALPAFEQDSLLVDTSASDGMTGQALVQAAAKDPAAVEAANAGAATEGEPTEAEVKNEAGKWKAAPAAPAPSPAPTAAPAPDPAATPAPSPAPSPAPTAAPAPAPVEEVPLGAKLPEIDTAEVIVTQADLDKRKTLKTDKAALFNQFADGDITKEDYEAKLTPIDDELERIAGDIAAQRGEELRVNAQLRRHWTALVATTMEAAKEIGLDYLGDKNLNVALDEAVKRYAKAAPLMNPDKSGAWQDAWALEQAHKEVARANGKEFTMKKGGEPGAPPQPTAAPAPAGARPAPNLETLPPTTRGAPPAGDPGISAGEFAHLEGLTPFDVERAVAKMTPEQQDRYLGI